MNPCGAWHDSKEFTTLVRKFHEKCAHSPAVENMSRAKQELTPLLNKLRDHLKRKGIVSGLNFQGSAYEGIKTVYSDLEFDCMFVLNNGNHITRSENYCPPGFAQLVISHEDTPLIKSWKVTDQIYGQHKIRQDLLKRKFKSEMQKSINEVGDRHMKLRDHGPAVQLDVYEDETCSALWFSVDMVPGFKEKGGRIYVAKSEDSEYSDSLFSFRQSFSEQEKSMIDKIDKGNQCHREVTRIVKTIREIDNTLRKLETYIIKTTLLHMITDKPHLDWSRGNQGRRLIDMLRALHNYLDRKQLPHFFVPEMNLLSGYSSINVRNMADRVQRLLNSEKEMRRVLNTDLRTKGVPQSGICEELESLDPFGRKSAVTDSDGSDSDSDGYGRSGDLFGGNVDPLGSFFSGSGSSYSTRGASSDDWRRGASVETRRQESGAGAGLGWMLLGGAALFGLFALGAAAVATAVKENKKENDKKK